MPQDIEKKHQFDAKKHEHKEAREDARAADAVNDAVLHGDNHTGQAGMMRQTSEPQEASDVKEVYHLLPDWHKDELRRLLVVPQGTRLAQGDIFCDLRFPQRGELVAHGEEEIHDELLVPKKGTDYEIWNKLLASGKVSPE